MQTPSIFKELPVRQNIQIALQHFVEQNLDTMLAISDRCYVMEKGRISANIAPGQVTPDEVRRHLMLSLLFRQANRLV
jgi:ABC-type lipopolysaccharide export system ATPase subunit